jgi:hypothetical protein
MIGRPTLYSQEIIDKSLDYLENFANYGDLIPQIAGLALHLGVRRDTLYEWAKEDGKEEFSDIFEAVKGKQEKTLINGSLGGELNPAISKMLLTKHGYSDKQEINTDVTSKGDKIQLPMHTFIKT